MKTAHAGRYRPGHYPDCPFKPGNPHGRRFQPGNPGRRKPTMPPYLDEAGRCYRVPLGNRTSEAVIDVADLPKVEGQHWMWSNHCGVIAHAANARRGVMLRMRRVIVGATDPKDEIVFADHDRLNHRRENLIHTDRCGVTRRGRKHRTHQGQPCSSQYKGVSWNKDCGRWQVTIRVDGRSTYLGLFDNEERAARAYDRVAFRAWGKHARLNFPEASR